LIKIQLQKKKKPQIQITTPMSLKEKWLIVMV